jgi:hypothetical protein
MAGTTRPMDKQLSRQVPRKLTNGLDASTRDLTAGRVSDADAPQHEARRMLEAFEKKPRANAKGGTRARTV